MFPLVGLDHQLYLFFLIREQKICPKRKIGDLIIQNRSKLKDKSNNYIVYLVNENLSLKLDFVSLFNGGYIKLDSISKTSST